MSDEIEIHFLKMEIEELKASAHQTASQTLNYFLDLKVMLEDDDVDEALDMLNELTGESK